MTARPQLTLVDGTFSVQFSDSAEAEVNALAWSDFEALQVALRNFAGSQGWVQTGKFEPRALPAAPSISFGSYRVALEVDPQRRTLRVTSVVSDSPGALRASSRRRPSRS